ncbi:MAG: MoaD/ThiS family protein [Deltaproteobacteria bacterium]|nr:MoaD/ThiS family protein [Deltaproteobacteria bacterium]
MKISAKFHGILSDWTGVQTADFDLPNSADMADLMQEIARRFRSNMPDPLWDDDNGTFCPQIVAFMDGKKLASKNAPLGRGGEVTFYTMVAGG